MIYSIYFGRFSSAKQEDGDSQRRQDTGFQAHLARTGTQAWATRYFDAGVSAWSEAGEGKHRQGDFGRLLKDIAGNKFPKGSILWVENLDRMSREDAWEKTVPEFRRILRAGLKIYLGCEEFNESHLANPYSMLPILVRAIGNKDFSDKISFRKQEDWNGKRARKATTTKHNVLSRVHPDWISISNGKYILNDYAKVIRQACLMAIQGHGQKSIKRALGYKFAGLGFTFHQRRLVGEWTPTKNRVATGEAILLYPPVLSEAEWQELQQALKSRTTHGKRRGNGANPASNLFTYLLFNDAGQPLVQTYAHAKKILKPQERKGKQLDYETFEYAVLNTCLINLPCGVEHEQPNQVEELDAKIARCESRLNSAMELLLDLDADDCTAQNKIILAMEKQKKDLEAQRDAERMKLLQTGDSSREQSKALVDALGDLQGDELKACRLNLKRLIAGLVKSITVIYTTPYRFKFIVELVGSADRHHFKQAKVA